MPRLRRPTVDVREQGARGNGKTLDTKAFQRAITEVAKQHGTVRVPHGTYRVGTMRLRSNVRLVLEAGATLLASTKVADFETRERLPYPTYSDVETSAFRNALVFGERLHDVAIVGEGTIDMRRERRFGPKPIALRRCRDVEVAGITIRRAPNYCVSLGGCDDVVVRGITVRDAFADGIDPDCCRRVRIEDCDIESDDDAVVLKSSLILGVPRPTEDVTVRRCRLNSPSNGFKIGTETSGDIRRVTVSDCRIDGRPRKGADPAGLVLAQEGGGVAIESVDGGHVDDIRVTDVTVRACDVPVFIRLGSRGRGQPTPAPGSIRNVTITRLTAGGATDACTLSGVPGHPVEGITFDDVHITTAPAAPPPTRPVPELEGEYPQAGMFGPLPASGFFVRHAAGVTLHEVTVECPPGRPIIVSDDVIRLSAEPPL